MTTMAKAASTQDVKLIAIGNSRGIRLPKALLQKYGWGDTLVLEELDTGILLYSKDSNKLSWENTYREMAANDEDWSEFDATVADGLD